VWIEILIDCPIRYKLHFLCVMELQGSLIVDSVIEKLFENEHFKLQLHDRIITVQKYLIQEFSKAITKYRKDIIEIQPENMVRVSRLIDDINGSVQQLVDIGLRSSLTTEFSVLTEDTLHVRGELHEIRA
jgi:hypothetical protein